LVFFKESGFCCGGKKIGVSCCCCCCCCFGGGGEEEGRGRGRELQKRKNKQNGAADVLEDLLHQPPVLVALFDDEADLFLLCESEQVSQSV